MRVGIARSYRLVCFAGRALVGIAFAGISFAGIALAGPAFAEVASLQTAGTGAEGHPTTACRFEAVSSGRVRAVADGRSFVLDDGREIVPINVQQSDEVAAIGRTCRT